MSEKIEFEAIVQYISGNMRGLVGVPHGKLPMGQRYKVTLEPVKPELLPCPFCGGDAYWGENFIRYGVSMNRIFCKDCPARVEHENKRKAVEAWNRRADG